MIPQRNISLISNSLQSAGGKRIPEAVIERDYVLAWFLTGLAGHPLRDVLAFKGGTALRRCWFEDYRFSEDLDFTLTRPITLEAILAGLNDIFVAIEAACGLRIAFDREDRHGHQNNHTFYLRYQGPLPASSDVKVDITINEVLCYPLQDRQIQRVERANGTLQDRLIKAMRVVEGIVEIDAANQWLPQFMARHNRRFAVEPADPRDSHRPLQITLEVSRQILARQYQRTLSKNLSCQFQGGILQARFATGGQGMVGASVNVLEHFDGEIE